MTGAGDDGAIADGAFGWESGAADNVGALAPPPERSWRIAIRSSATASRSSRIASHNMLDESRAEAGGEAARVFASDVAGLAATGCGDDVGGAI